MSDKLKRARHIRDDQGHLKATTGDGKGHSRGKHGKEAPKGFSSSDPGLTGALFVGGAHAGRDKTADDNKGDTQKTCNEQSDSRDTVSRGSGSLADSQLVANETQSVDRAESVGSSAALISVCVIVSRITGFARTWAMAFALGATFVSSSYQVANNLPNMLYELVMGGMLVTAFLPVYMSVKKKLGQERSNEYASNLLTIVVALLGIVSVLCMLFPAQVIYTQTFYSDQEEMSLAVFFFQFFAVQIVFYGGSTIISGLLNANREYFWSSFAPVFNNVIVIISFCLYAFLAQANQNLAFYCIAIGNPLGVFVQMAIQIPALKKVGIRLRPRIDFRDPALRDTLALGAPAIFVTICSFATVSVQNAASYCFADNGPSVIAYARLWFTLPYAILAVPVTTSMFTELSDMQADDDTPGVIEGIIDGTRQIIYLMVPFALYLVVFSTPLVTLYHIGAFSDEAIGQIASYLAVMAVALPFYGVNAYLNKVFSSIRKMGVFSVVTFVGVAAQIVVTAAAAWGVQNGIPVTIEAIAASTIASYVISDILAFAYLRRLFGPMGLGKVALSMGRSLLLGGAGAAVGAGILWILETVFGPLDGGIVQAVLYIVAGGLPALIVTFAPAVHWGWPEAAFVAGVVHKVGRRLKRK